LGFDIFSPTKRKARKIMKTQMRIKEMKEREESTEPWKRG